MSNYLKTLAEASELLAERQPFTTGTLSARWFDVVGGGSVYSVWSYDEEIATLHEGGERFINSNAYTHSKTTSKHANIVKKAWGL